MKLDWSQSPQTGQVYFNERYLAEHPENSFSVSIPSNGSSLFQWQVQIRFEYERILVSIPSNGSSLFQFLPSPSQSEIAKPKSQSPQTGQVYFNHPSKLTIISPVAIGLNPLKRVKFISIVFTMLENM